MKVDLSPKNIAILVVICILLAIGTFFLKGSHSSFEATKAFIESNEEVAKSIGPIQKVSPSFFGKSSYGHFDGTDQAKYSVDVVGKNGSGKVDVFLVVEAGFWRMRSATFTTGNGEVVTLKEASQ